MAPGSPPSVAAEHRPASARAGSVPLVGGGAPPLAFILAGLAALAAAVGWLLTQPSLLALPYLHPQVVAFVHLWLPGFLLSVCIGAVYQLMPVVLGEPLAIRVSVLWIHLALHVAGLVALITAFASGQYAWAGVGGTSVTAGAIILFVATIKTFVRSKRRDAVAWCFPLATGWLAATVLFGVALAINRRAPWLPLSAVNLLRAHAHLGLAGFFLTLLQGTTFQLVPIFTMGEARRPRLIRAGLVGSQAGLLLLAPGLAWDLPVLTHAGAIVFTAAIGCSAVAFHATFRSRRRKKIEPGLHAFVAGCGLLALGVIIGAGLAFAPAGHAATPRWFVAYGLVLIPGALSLVVLGMLCKIMPFLVWMRAYAPKVGKQTVPIATALASRRLEFAWLTAHVAGLALLVVGQTRLGGIVLAIGAACFFANTARVLLHLRPQAHIALP